MPPSVEFPPLSGVLEDVVGLLLTFAVAGWFAGYIALPERLPLATRLLLSLALSVPATALVGTLALIARRLDAATLLLGFAVLGVVALLRVAPRLLRERRERAAAPSATADAPATEPATPAGSTHVATPRGRIAVSPPSGARGRWALGALTFAGAAVLAVVALAGQLGVRTAEGIPPGTTWWYYYALVLDMIDARAIPATIGEWGSARPYPVEYLTTTLHTASAAIFSGGLDLSLIEGYRLFVLGLVAVAAYALWRRWLPAWWAWVAAVPHDLRHSGRLAARWLSPRDVRARPRVLVRLVARRGAASPVTPLGTARRPGLRRRLPRPCRGVAADRPAVDGDRRGEGRDRRLARLPRAEPAARRRRGRSGASGSTAHDRIARCPGDGGGRVRRRPGPRHRGRHGIAARGPHRQAHRAGHRHAEHRRPDVAVLRGHQRLRHEPHAAARDVLRSVLPGLPPPACRSRVSI